MKDYKAIFQSLITNVEHEVIEFKSAENQYDRDKLGKYFSALSNEANLRDKQEGWLIFGVDNNKNIVGSAYRENGGLQNLKKDITFPIL